MKCPDLIARYAWCAFACVGMACLSSCSSPSVDQSNDSPVRKVVAGQNPRTHAVAERARKIADLHYAAICALLDDGHSDFPKQFDICFTQTANGNMAQTRLDQIRLNAEYLDEFENEPGTLDQVVVHEMTHVAQHYYRPIIGRWLINNPRPAKFWVEGMADYVCFRLSATNHLHCGECNSVFPHYKDGYSCAAAFLLYLERTYNRAIVPQLNAVLRRGDHSDDFFFQMTGKDLETLWTEFRQTPAFTRGAARMLDLQQTLGYVCGKAPKDIEQRLKSFMEAHADEPARELIKDARVQEQTPKDLQTRVSLVYYFTQPGGTAEAFMLRLQKQHELPGFSKGEHGTVSYALSSRDLSVTFPVTRSFTASKHGETSIYHYTVYRASEETDWKLQRAWRIRPDGAVLTEFPVP
jgi:hypothetical protein